MKTAILILQDSLNQQLEQKKELEIRVPSNDKQKEMFKKAGLTLDTAIKDIEDALRILGIDQKCPNPPCGSNDITHKEDYSMCNKCRGLFNGKPNSN